MIPTPQLKKKYITPIDVLDLPAPLKEYRKINVRQAEHVDENIHKKWKNVGMSWIDMKKSRRFGPGNFDNL